MDEIIIREARKWIGARFRWHGRVKCGIDCLGLIICVGDIVGHVYDNKPISFYDISYSSNSDFNKIKEYFSIFYRKKSIDDLASGDIVLQKINNNQYHLGIYTGITIIHASLINRCVVENRFDIVSDFEVFSYVIK